MCLSRLLSSNANTKTKREKHPRRPPAPEWCPGALVPLVPFYRHWKVPVPAHLLLSGLDPYSCPSPSSWQELCWKAFESLADRWEIRPRTFYWVVPSAASAPGTVQHGHGTVRFPSLAGEDKSLYPGQKADLSYGVAGRI